MNKKQLDKREKITILKNKDLYLCSARNVSYIMGIL